MSIKFTKKIVSTRGAGRVATEPQVRVAENGQLGFNSLAMKVLEGMKLGIWGTDAEDGGAKRKETTCQLKAITQPKSFPVKVAGESFAETDFVKIGWSKENKSCYSAMAPEFKAIGYDFKASGPQGFACEVDEKNHTVTFKVPVGSLTPLPKQTRVKKEKSAANGVSKSAAAGASAELEQELELS